MNYIIAVGVFQALIAAVLLRNSRTRSKADDLLLWLLLCIAVHLSIKFIIFTVLDDKQVQAYMNTFVGLCYGPLLYLYARKKQDELFIPATRWYLFLPFVAAAIAYLTVTCLLLVAPAQSYPLLRAYNNSSLYVFLLFNLYFTIRTWKTGSTLPERLSVERRMIRRIALLFFALFATGCFFYLLSLAGINNYNILARTIAYSLLLLCCVVILQHKYTINAAREEVPRLFPEAAASPEVVAERRSQMPEELQSVLFAQLESFLGRSRLYLDADLTLDRLAQTSGINRHQLSEVLNHHAGKSFYQYINEYRVREVQLKMLYFQERSLPVNILSLAYECGFKAKSSFNQYFKKISGQTPTEYLKALEGTARVSTIAC